VIDVLCRRDLHQPQPAGGAQPVAGSERGGQLAAELWDRRYYLNHQTALSLMYTSNQRLLLRGALTVKLAGVITGLLLPAIQSAREAALRSSTLNNLKQVGLAFHGDSVQGVKVYSIDSSGGKTLLDESEWSKIDDNAEVDLSALSQLPGAAESLGYGLINYSKVATRANFAALAEIIQYDELTGSNLRQIGDNPNSQGSFDVVIGERGEKLRLQGSELNDLFQVRGNGRLVASGGGGRDLYYSNSRKSEMVIKDFSSEDLVRLDRFGDRAVRRGNLQLFQEGQHALISFEGDTLLTLRKTDAERLIFSQGSITLAPDPLA
jgi:hypothetical protein